MSQQQLDLFADRASAHTMRANQRKRPNQAVLLIRSAV